MHPADDTLLPVALMNSEQDFARVRAVALADRARPLEVIIIDPKTLRVLGGAFTRPDEALPYLWERK